MWINRARSRQQAVGSRQRVAGSRQPAAGSGVPLPFRDVRQNLPAKQDRCMTSALTSAPQPYAISYGQLRKGNGAVDTYTGPLKQRPMSRRARVACGRETTRTSEFQWYRRASRSTYSASPRVSAGLGSKQMSAIPGGRGGHGLPYPLNPCETTSTGARCSLASRSATGMRSPGPASITIALT